jgi:hypothetical protein
MKSHPKQELLVELTHCCYNEEIIMFEKMHEFQHPRLDITAASALAGVLL